jgi:hypothetical protein
MMTMTMMIRIAMKEIKNNNLIIMAREPQYAIGVLFSHSGMTLAGDTVCFPLLLQGKMTINLSEPCVTKVPSNHSSASLEYVLLNTAQASLE